MAGLTRLEELNFCKREGHLLKDKLEVQLLRWEFDKAIMEEASHEMNREQGLKIAEKSYEATKADLQYGAQLQKNYLLERRLESEQREVEHLNVLMHVLKCELQQEKVNKDLAVEKMKTLKADLRDRFVQERDKRNQHFRKVLDNRQRSYKEGIEKIKQRHHADIAQLNSRFRLAIDELDTLKNEQERWTRDTKELQTLVSERHKLQKRLEELSSQRDKMQTLLDEKDKVLLEKELEMQQMATENDKPIIEHETCSSHQKKVGVLLGQRDRSLVEKERWTLQEHEMHKVSAERDNLLQERDKWKLKEKEMQEAVTERDQLKHKLHGKESDEFFKWVKERDKLAHKVELVEKQREEEVQGIMRERDFVWSQMKKIEGDYTEKLKSASLQITLANEEVAKLTRDLEQARAESTEKMVAMTVLKLEAKQVEDESRRLKEDLAVKKQDSFLRHAPHIKLTDVEESGKRFSGEGPTRRPSLPDLTLQIANLQKQLETYKSLSQEETGSGYAIKEVPEVLNAEEVVTWDQETFVSQVEQGTKAKEEDERKASKGVEELRRENENLRVLYGQLEALYKEKQKPEKVARTVNRRDPTSRNLKIELEAAAASSPSDDDVLRKNVVGKLKRRDSGSKAKSVQKAGKELRKEIEDALLTTELEETEGSIKKALGSGRSKQIVSNRKPPVPTSSKRGGRQEIGLVNKELKRDGGGDNSEDVQGVKMESNGGGSTVGRRRKRKLESENLDETQRAPLQQVNLNGTKTTSSMKSRFHSSHTAESESLNSVKKSGSLMANLFSSAFSIPRLSTRASAVSKT